MTEAQPSPGRSPGSVGPVATPPRRRRLGLVAAGVVSGLLLLAPGRAAEVEEEVLRPFRFGFSTVLMPEASENDARAAMRVWAETVVDTGAVHADPDVVICSSLAPLSQGLRDRTLDGVAISLPELVALRRQVSFNRYVFTTAGGSITEDYVLLVHQAAGLTRLEELRGRTLLVYNHSRMCLAVPWLDTALVEAGLKPAQEHFKQVTRETKLSKAVLPVFFRKADACLVTRRGFLMMGELNPQVSQRVVILAVSKPYVPTGFFFRSGFPAREQQRCLEQFTQVHTSPVGQQIMTVFQTERLEEHPASVLDESLALLEKHDRLCRSSGASTNQAPAVAGPGGEGERAAR